MFYLFICVGKESKRCSVKNKTKKTSDVYLYLKKIKKFDWKKGHSFTSGIVVILMNRGWQTSKFKASAAAIKAQKPLLSTHIGSLISSAPRNCFQFPVSRHYEKPHLSLPPLSPLSGVSVTLRCRCRCCYRHPHHILRQLQSYRFHPYKLQRNFVSRTLLHLPLRLCQEHPTKRRPPGPHRSCYQPLHGQPHGLLRGQTLPPGRLRRSAANRRCPS